MPLLPSPPLLLLFSPPATVAAQVRIPDTARADGWMSHDATEAVTMKKGTYVKLSTAAIPLPTVSCIPVSRPSVPRSYVHPPTCHQSVRGRQKTLNIHCWDT